MGGDQGRALTWRKKVENRATLGEMHEIKDDKSSHSLSVETGIK